MNASTGKRPWYQFSLRTLLLTTLLFGTGLGMFGAWIKRGWNQADAVKELRKLGATVKYDWETGKTPARGPNWMRRAFGGDVFDRVATVKLRETEVTDDDLRYLAYLKGLKKLDLSFCRVSDAGLAHLRGQTDLEWLNLNDAQLTDAGLTNLERLTALRVLYLDYTDIGDTGLVHLRRLEHLEVLDLLDTAVTDAGVKELQEVLPDCRIVTELR